MTVGVVDRSVSYTAVGSAGPYTIPFQFFEIAVYLDGVLVSPTLYTITWDSDEAGQAGQIDFIDPDNLPTGALLIVGATAVTQQTDYAENGAFPADSHEKALDRLTMIAQEHATQLDAFADDATTAHADRLAADASAAAASVDQLAAAASAAAAYASQVLADADATNAAASAVSASSSAASAIAAASAAGAFTVFATKAAANSGLSGISANAFVMVLIDESRSNARTVYQKVTGSYVYTYTFPGAKEVHLSKDDGNDSNTGLTPADPKQTTAAAVAIMGVGDTLRPKRASGVSSSRFFEQLTGLPKNAKIVPYGFGFKPRWDGSRKIAAVAWTADGTYADQWYADVTQQVITVPGGVSANAFHCNMWVEEATARDVNCTPYLTGVSIAANRLYISTRPYYFTCHRQGSTVADPRTDTASTLYRYRIQMPAGVDPSAAAVDIYYAEQQAVANLSEGCSVKDVIFQRTANKDMVGLDGAHGGVDLLDNVEFIDAAVHGWVGSAVHHRGSRAVTNVPASDGISLSNARQWGGGGLHEFRPTGTSGKSRGALLEDVYVENYGNGIYSHGTGGPNEHPSVLVRRPKVRGCNIALAAGLTDKGWTVEDADVFDCDCLSETSANMRFIRPRYISSAIANLFAFSLEGDNLYVEDGVFIFRSSTGRMYGNSTALSNNDGTTYNVTLNRVTKVGGALCDANARRRQVNLTVTDSVLGECVESGTTYPWSLITATNTQLSVQQTSLAQLIAANAGINANCVCPWNLQDYLRTIISADISYANSTRTVSMTSGDATKTLTFNFRDNNLIVGQAVRVFNYDGAGTNFDTTIATLGATGSSGTVTVVDAIPATAAGKQFWAGYFNRKVCPESAGTCVISNDGTQAYLSNPELFSINMWIYIGALDRRDALGLVQITALSGSTATLSRALTWRKSNSNVTYAPFGTTTGVVRPSFAVSFAFPLRGYNAAFADPQYSLTKNVGAAVITGAEVNTGTGNFSGLLSLAHADGTVASYGQLRHEEGYVDTGFPVGVSDSLEVKAVAYMEDHVPAFLGDPALSGRALLVRNSRMAALGMGARWSK